jgi:hypothetical protein
MVYQAVMKLGRETVCEDHSCEGCGTRKLVRSESERTDVLQDSFHHHIRWSQRPSPMALFLQPADMALDVPARRTAVSVRNKWGYRYLDQGRIHFGRWSWLMAGKG